MKPDVQRIKENIKIIVNRIDPWYLIEIGAPDDEYNSYTDKIVSFVVNKEPDKSELENHLQLIFSTKEFELSKDKIHQLASEILQIV